MVGPKEPLADLHPFPVRLQRLVELLQELVLDTNIVVCNGQNRDTVRLDGVDGWRMRLWSWRELWGSVAVGRGQNPLRVS